MSEEASGTKSATGCLVAMILAVVLAIVATVIGFFWLVDRGPLFFSNMIEAAIFEGLEVEDVNEKNKVSAQMERLRVAWEDERIDSKGLIRIAEDLEPVLYTVEYWPRIRDAVERFYERRLALETNDIDKDTIRSRRAQHLEHFEKAFAYLIRGAYSIDKLHQALVVPFLQNPEAKTPDLRSVTTDLLEEVDRRAWGGSDGENESAASTNPAATPSGTDASDTTAAEVGFVRAAERQLGNASEGLSAIAFSAILEASIDVHLDPKTVADREDRKSGD